MEFNLNVKIRGGQRTPVEVSACSTAVNPRVMVLKGGEVITDAQIAAWIEHELTDVLENVQAGCPAEGDFDAA